MAFHLASSSGASTVPSFGFSVTEKLAHNNYPMWKMQVLSALKGAQLASFINSEAKPPSSFLEPMKVEDKKEPPKTNPEFESWVAKDQTVLHFLLSSLSKEILGQVPTTVASAKEAWTAIDGMFASQSRAHIISTRMALATASKGASSISEFFVKMKALVDEMASAGRKIEDEELVSYILMGLDREYDPVVSAVAARVEPISVGELYTQLTSFEQRMEMKNGGGGYQSSSNMASRGGRGNYRGGARGGGGRGGFGCGQRGGRTSGRPQGSFQAGVICQLCGKEGHTVVKCFKRFDASFTGPP
ncbi:uncharacterized protein LOC110437500 [Sorghum bicolor]|uniref:uncharacterized protein LOC110437500 n=1 Tax=Sorghum bicolor TaxID=4558 RepID=UPI000B4246CA|nr:uncharacterized protein LOC110437500 [Sorghum bicolor]|eukprot:XP_021321638.1 uncharacterized protein LOC110437500 [Sorghum bicolor]